MQQTNNSSKNIEIQEYTLTDIWQYIMQWYRYLLPKKWIIISLSILGLVLGILYSKIISKYTYTAEVSFVLDENKGGGGLSNLAGLAGLAGGGDGGLFSQNNLLQLLGSRSLIERTLLSPLPNNKKILLVDYYVEKTHQNEDWKNNDRLKNFRFSQNQSENYQFIQDSILNIFCSHIKQDNLIYERSKDNKTFFSISAKAADELLAKYLSEMLVQNLLDLYVRTKTQKARNDVDNLQRKADSVKAELNSALYGRATFSDQNLNLINQQAALPRIRKELDVQILTTLYAELIKNVELAKVALLKAEPYLQYVDKPVLPLVKKKVGIVKGGLIGGFLFGFLSVLFFIYQKFLKKESFV